MLYLKCWDLGNCLEYPPCWCLDLKSAWSLVSLIFRSSTVGKPWGLLGVPSLFEYSILMRLGAEEACDNNLDPLPGQSNCGD